MATDLAKRLRGFRAHVDAMDDKAFHFFWDVGGPRICNEAANRIDFLKQVLRTAKNKLKCYRKEHGGNYVGGMEYTQLMKIIEEALSE